MANGVCKSKPQFIENLRSCFPGQTKVHISDIAQNVGHQTALRAKKFADTKGFVIIK